MSRFPPSYAVPSPARGRPHTPMPVRPESVANGSALRHDVGASNANGLRVDAAYAIAGSAELSVRKFRNEPRDEPLRLPAP